MKRPEECLARFDESTSILKDTAQSFMGNMAAMAHAAADDEILKNTFANNAFENYELAAYTSLLAICGPAGADNCKAALEANLGEEEEEAMADWIQAKDDSGVPQETSEGCRLKSLARSNARTPFRAPERRANI
jgi:ferritin-like metal-binding protein YciE